MFDYLKVNFGPLLYIAAFLALVLTPVARGIFNDGKPERDRRRFQEDINARFEKNVKMATDATNETQREMGFVVLGQMFSTKGKNFDALTEENKAVLEYLISKNPLMTEAQREACKELYRKRGKSHAKES